ncbi:hypothetical protein GZL_02383 [Streptomyces sp. 769]|nr:hypothetical protein GZL_02383 [Streptomyces sp. 769]
MTRHSSYNLLFDLSAPRTTQEELALGAQQMSLLGIGR